MMGTSSMSGVYIARVREVSGRFQGPPADESMRRKEAEKEEGKACIGGHP